MTSCYACMTADVDVFTKKVRFTNACLLSLLILSAISWIMNTIVFQSIAGGNVTEETAIGAMGESDKGIFFDFISLASVSAQDYSLVSPNEERN